MSGPKQTTALMRQMGSESGNWNPLPPEHHLYPILRPDIQLNLTERTLLAWVQSKTVDRFKGEDFPQQQTVECHDSRGDLTLIHAQKDLGLDLSNLAKAATVLEDHGFITHTRRGVIRMCAAGLLEEGRKNSEAQKHTGLYKPVPEYVFDAIKGLSENQRSAFLTRWGATEQWEDDALAQAKILIYQHAIQRRQALCKEVGIDLKSFGGRGKTKEPKPGHEPESPKLKIVQMSFLLDPDSNEFVQTSKQKPVQTSSEHAYKPEPEFVPGDASLYSSEVEKKRIASSARGSAEKQTKAQTRSSENAATDEPETHELDAEIQLRIHRSRLKTLDGKPIDAATVRNIRSHLLRLPTGGVEIRHVLEVLEDKCRQLRANDGGGKGWGWVVGVVKGEVDRILKQSQFENEDLHGQFHELAAKKGMR